MILARKSLVVVASAFKKHKSITPRNWKQETYIDLLTQEKPHVVIATGAAGTGKTMLATHVGVKKLISDEVRKIVITRPAVSVDEQHGFLPGSLEKKMEPWIRPVWDVLLQYYPRSKLDMLMRDQVIEICPLAYMRGRTFEDSWIICDEAQNTTPSQMLMVLTRIGKNSKVVITGDPQQYDRGFDNNGLSDLLDKLYTHDNVLDDGINIVHFDENDVERHPIIKDILRIYAQST
jgi:phosphate starvation-inducible PhoH-like protein